MGQSGKKNDQGKVDLSLIPRSALEAMAIGFTLGQHKYGRNNYKLGLEANRLIASSLRHLTAWASGEEMDPDPVAREHDIPATHLGNALCGIAMLIELQRLGRLKDDRDLDSNYSGVDSSVNFTPEAIINALDMVRTSAEEGGKESEQKETDTHWAFADTALSYLK